jgi:hypothetical protein
LDDEKAKFFCGYDYLFHFRRILFPRTKKLIPMVKLIHHSLASLKFLAIKFHLLNYAKVSVEVIMIRTTGPWTFQDFATTD